MSKYLIIQLARFGDILQTKRLVRSLAREREVVLCVDNSLKTLAQLVYPQQEVIGVPAHGASETDVFKGSLELFTRLKNESYDGVYILNHSGLSRAIASLFPAEIVRGYLMSHGQSLQSNWVRLAFRWMAQRTIAPLNLVDFWAALAGADMIEPDKVNPVALPGGKGIGVVLAGQQARRSLPPEVLALVIRVVFERLGGPPVYLLGTKQEAVAGRELARFLPNTILDKTENLAGKTDWQALIQVIHGLDVVLSPDTGTAHLAAHLGTPVEGFFLSSAWAFETGPYGKGHKVWQAVRDCSPCIESAFCPHNVECGQVFSSPAFLATLQGRKKEQELTGKVILLKSEMDALGQIWTPIIGTDEYYKARSSLRAILGSYLGFTEDFPIADKQMLTALAQGLFQESDWILPQLTP